jgi:D-alanine-D-alanine ligase
VQVSAVNVKTLGRVAVLMGGWSAERQVSLWSGEGVLSALQSAGVDAIGFDPSQRDLRDLVSERVQRVFIALHGRYGEDGALQGALELLKIPYTGSGVMASAIAMDKLMTKRIWLAEGLPTPRFVALRRTDKLNHVPDELGLPLIVKPPHEGSTIGINKVNGYSEMQAAFEDAAKYDDVVLAEEFIAGRELTVAVLGEGDQARALPVIEIVVPGGNYDFEHKYLSDATQYLCPAPLDAALTERIQSLAVKAYNAIGCSGWGRVDFMLRASDSAPFLLEINTSPGMTGHSLVPIAAKAAGLSYEALCLHLAANAALKTGGKQAAAVGDLT